MLEDDQYLHAMESVPLDQIVKTEYRNYQIYTLMDRAIPYLQDGLKPGQRRILYTLWKNQSKGLMKVSSATGLVLTLHPHGPASVESTIVNLAQDYTFSNNYPLIDKKGYFGERMETAPAASRYIECKLGKISQWLIFDDLNQVEMVPNYDEKVMEPLALLPKLPLMLLNGAEGIGTGFSSVIPSYHHKDIIASMSRFIETGKAKKIHPWARAHSEKILKGDNGRLVYPMRIIEEDGRFFITELPRGYDASKVYKYLAKYIESDFLKDFIDSSVGNKVSIELLFKRGVSYSLKEVQEEMSAVSTMVPNFTLISERGVRIFAGPEEIIEIFTQRRLDVVKTRYELLAQDTQKRITQNNEIIRFIKQKHYEKATKVANRKAFVEYLGKSKFEFKDYLADMPIYRMTKEEVAKRVLLVKEDSVKLKNYKKIASSKRLIEKELLAELAEVDVKMSEWIKLKDKEDLKLVKDSEKMSKKQKKAKKRK